MNIFFPYGSVVKKKKKKICLPMQETRVRSLGQEDPLEKELATHSSVLAWEIPWTQGPCPTLCDSMECSLPGSSVHGILQAKTLEWVAISSFRGYS